jgi:acetoacetyl-CoA synthetase
MQRFNDLYKFSVTDRSIFWDQCFQFLNLIYSGSYTRIVDESARMDSIPRWFEGVYINFAENLLYSRDAHDSTSKRGMKGKEDRKIALTEVREGSTEIRDVSWGQLRSEVAELTSAMKSNGFRKGDRCAIVASNSVDTLKVFLATTALGGIFSSSSTDMGTKGVLDRLLQIEPKVGYHIPVAKIN